MGRFCFDGEEPEGPEKGCAALDVAAGRPSGRGFVVVVVAEVTGVEERVLVVVKERVIGVVALRRASRWRQRLQIMVVRCVKQLRRQQSDPVCSSLEALKFEMASKRAKLRRASEKRT